MSQSTGQSRSRRALLRWSVFGALATGATLLAACGGGAASSTTEKKAEPAKPAESKPTDAAKPAATAKPAEAAKPTGGTPITGAGIGGAQPTAIPTAVGDLKNPATFTGPKIKASAATTLTFWHYAGFHVTVQKLIAEEYKKQHDANVSLEITAYPGLNEQRTAVKAALAAGSATPDIIAVEPGAYAVDVFQNKSVIGFGKIFEADQEYQRAFWPNALQLLTINGETVSVPVVTNTVVVYYNKKLFADAGAKVPETLQELRALAPLFTGKGIAPLTIAIGEDRNHPIFPFYTMVGGAKLDKTMREADLGKAPWTSPELVEAGQRAEELIRSDLIAKGVLGLKQADAIQQFVTGKAAMFWAGQWLRTSIRQALPPDFDLGLFPFPAISSGGGKVVLSSTGITLTVNAKSKSPDVAFEMIKAITGAWGKIEYSKALGISPNGPISAEAIAYQMQSLKDPLYPEFLKLQPTGTTRVLFTPQIEEALYQGWQAVIAGQKSSKQVLEETEAASKKAGERKFTVG